MRRCQALVLIPALVVGCPKGGGLDGATGPGAIPWALEDARMERVAPSEAELAARWLLAYDEMAWHSSDLVMTEPPEVTDQLGSEWFAYTQDDVWHAAYGRWDEDGDRYLCVLHYLLEAPEAGIVKTRDEPDPAIVDPLGRAVHNAAALIPAAWKQAGIRYNVYTRSVHEGIEVYWIPAWQTDGTVVIGNSMCLLMDPQGRELLRQTSWEPGWASLQPDPDALVVLPSPNGGDPSPFELFFLLYYRGEFRSLLMEHGDAVYGTIPAGDGVPVVVRYLKPS